MYSLCNIFSAAGFYGHIVQECKCQCKCLHFYPGLSCITWACKSGHTGEKCLILPVACVINPSKMTAIWDSFTTLLPAGDTAAPSRLILETLSDCLLPFGLRCSCLDSSLGS